MSFSFSTIIFNCFIYNQRLFSMFDVLSFNILKWQDSEIEEFEVILCLIDKLFPTLCDRGFSTWRNAKMIFFIDDCLVFTVSAKTHLDKRVIACKNAVFSLWKKYRVSFTIFTCWYYKISLFPNYKNVLVSLNGICSSLLLLLCFLIFFSLFESLFIRLMWVSHRSCSFLLLNSISKLKNFSQKSGLIIALKNGLTVRGIFLIAKNFSFDHFIQSWIVLFFVSFLTLIHLLAVYKI